MKRRKRATAIEGLKASADHLDALIAQDPRPVQGLLVCRMSSLRTAWEEFAKAHEALFGKVAEERMDTEVAIFRAQTKVYNEALDRASVFKAGYGEPVAVPPTLEVKVEDLLRRRTAFYDRAEEKVDRILVVLDATETPSTPASLQAQLLMLDEVQGNLEVAMTLTDDLIGFASDRAGNFRTQGNSRDQVIQAKIQQARTGAGDLGVSSAQQTGAEDQKVRDYPRSSQFLLKKRPFPHFDGLKRNFPSFRREWTEIVTKAKFPPDHELRELKRCTPKVVQPDIKNLKTVSAVWELLNLQYRQLLELTSELIKSLTNFQ